MADGTKAHIPSVKPQVSFVERTQRNADARDIAKEAITLLEKRIHDEFGVTIKMGAELEFGVLLHKDHWPDTFADDVPFASKGKYASTSRGTMPSCIRDVDDRCPQFPDSTRVAYSYLDGEHRTNGWNTIEFILTHDPQSRQFNSESNQYEYRPVKRSMKAFAHEIEALYQQVCKPVTGYKNNGDYSGETSKNPGKAQARAWQKTYNDDIASIYAQSFLPQEGMAFGLHLNFSLWDDEGKSWNLRSDHRQFANQMALSTGNIFADNAYLVMPDAIAAKRLSHQFNLCDMPSFKHHHVGHSRDGYYENKICGIDTDPYYAVMLQLAAIYDGLQQFQGSQPSLKEEQTPIIINEGYCLNRVKLATMFDAKTLRDDFRDPKHNSLRGLLNELQPDLGDRFIDAALHGRSVGAQHHTITAGRS